MCPPNHTDPAPAWDQLYAENFRDRIPEAVFRSLTEDEKTAVWSAWNASGTGRLSGLSFETEVAALTNRGLAYLLLTRPAKYTLWDQAAEDLVLELLAWDAEHLDDIHARHMSGTREELLLDQRFRSFCAVLHNASVTAGSVRTLLAGLQQDWDATYPDAAGMSFGELLDDQLWDKWDPEEIPAGTLAVLERFFRDHGLTAAADRMTPAAMATRRAERAAYYAE